MFSHIVKFSGLFLCIDGSKMLMPLILYSHSSSGELHVLVNYSAINLNAIWVMIPLILLHVTAYCILALSWKFVCVHLEQ